MGTYEFLPHTADEKFHVVANDIEDAFITAVAAFHEILVGKDIVAKKETKTITLQGTKLRSLLYDFLNEFVFFFDDQDLLLPHVNSLYIREINGDYFLEAEVCGDKRSNYDLITEIKNMTYSDMEIIQRTDDSGQGTGSVELFVVVDI
jgi:SHS2 domain-containing protein